MGISPACAMMEGNRSTVRRMKSRVIRGHQVRHHDAQGQSTRVRRHATEPGRAVRAPAGSEQKLDAGQPRPVRRFAVLGFACLLSFLAPLPLLAGPAEITQVHVGLDQTVRLGCWTPVRLTIAGGDAGFSGDIELAALDGEGVSARYVESVTQFQVAAGETWTGWRYLKVGRSGTQIAVRLRSAGGRLVHERVVTDYRTLSATDQWVVTLGPEVQAADAARMLDRMLSDRMVAGRLDRAAFMPDQWYGWDGVTVLIITTGSDKFLNAWTDSQVNAVQLWLKLGGRLILSAGRRAEAMFAEESPWHALRPGEYTETDARWKATGLENLARSRRLIVNRDDVRLPVFDNVRGRVICWEGAGSANEHPLVTEYPFGLGLVTYLALDLELSPLASWPGRQRMLTRLLQTRSEDEESAMGNERLGQLAHIGFSDLTGQMRVALEQFRSVTLVRFSWVAGLILVYVLLIGPLDYWLLRRWGRAEWTWLSFPVIVVSFCALAIWLSSQWQGEQRRVNQMDIVDLDAEAGVVRGTSWATVYSPEATQVDVNARITSNPLWKDAESQLLMSWQGSPGEGLRGMGSTGGTRLSSTAYTISPRTEKATDKPAIAGLPIDNSSTRPLVARWTAPVTVPGQTPTLRIAPGGLLTGRVTNPWSVELSRCSLYFQNWAFRLEGKLAPGQSAELRFLTPLDLKWQLTRRRVVDSGDVSTPWNRSDFSDPPRIAELLMFHGAAGGRAYTRLTHRYQAFLDLSRHLRLGRAILVGQVSRPALRLSCDGASVDDQMDHHWTFYRAVLPVARASGEAVD